MELDYNVTIHLEVLREGFAELLSDIRRLKDVMDIKVMDQQQPISIFEKQVIDVYHAILGPSYNTMNDVYELKGQLTFARGYVKDMEIKYVRRMERTEA